MLNIFGNNKSKKLKKDYEAKLEKAMQAQRSGDIRSYSALSKEADALYQELQALEKKA